ncbi:YhdP family protein [Vibrio gangliei]|uniref:YhdP family protein n=1 Tax=Vibrio gangliei TaxID=2077090 RepID=UPI001474759D|nr:YhdP family protein [Vibrio gangliei]
MTEKTLTLATRIWRGILWAVLTIVVFWAISVTLLRLFLPNLDQFRENIEAQVQKATGVQVEFDSVRAYWGNLTPALALKHVQVFLPGEEIPIVTIDRADAEIDFLASLIHFTPKLADVKIQGLRADVSRWPLVPEKNSSTNKPTTDTSLDALKDVQNLFLRQLGEFSLTDSSIQYLAPNGEIRLLDIDRLRWQNNGNQHKAEGLVSIAGVNLNKVSVIANFTEHGNLRDLDGEFYVSAQNIRVTPWMPQYIKKTTSIDSGRVSLNTWLTLKQGKPTDALVELMPSYLIWGEEDDAHQLDIKHGVVQLQPDGEGWKIQGSQFQFKTNNDDWPAFQFALDWQKDHQAFNISRLDIQYLAPLVGVLHSQNDAMTWLNNLQPSGSIEDIRVDIPKQKEQFTYSAKLTDAKIKQWDLLPGVNKLQASVTGNADNASIKATLDDDVVPYGEVFQAPLNIEHSKVNLVWQRYDDGWKIWSDKIQVSNEDLSAIGEFQLDFKAEQSPFLSLYVEADAHKAGETWRYLPTLALGRDLTDYLSSAIQAGSAKTAKILWYGALEDFPYTNRKGIFQAQLSLKDARFSFDTAWPSITNLQLDLLFENQSMYLHSTSADLMDVHANKIDGVIPDLAPDGHIEIHAQAQGEGASVRDYMMSTPLVDSVGAALTAVRVTGPVDAELNLSIPFNGDDADVSGFANLKDNPIEVQTPSIQLEHANGKITFNNDVVSGSGLKAQLLNQDIALDFNSHSQGQGYSVGIDVVGDTDMIKLKQQIDSVWLKPLAGNAPWNLGVDIQLNDIGFTYQIDGNADLEFLTSQYPAPLGKALGIKGKGRVQAAGNQETVNARITLPNVKYQADVDIRQDTPVLTATNLIIGRGDFKVSPIGGHYLSLNNNKFNADEWIDFVMDGEHSLKVKPADKDPVVVNVDSGNADVKAAQQSGDKAAKHEVDMPAIPMPEVISINTQTLVLGELDWHKVKLNAIHRPQNWRFNLSSSEIVGTGEFRNKKDLNLDLKSVHIFVPQWDNSEDSEPTLISDKAKDEPLISEFDRQFHQYMPNLSLKINDLWLQGYKVGTVDMQLQREKNRLVWKNLDFKTGSNHLKAKGWWELAGEKSHSNFDMSLTGKNNSEVMARFGINSGIQKASFDISIASSWDGSPWSVKTDTLSGQVKTEFKDGVITDVNGAARLLGLFSLDSIVRKMKLDFTGVFDDGMTFDSIKGSGKISRGVFVTNDLEMDGAAGDMTLKGKADLNTRLVDAEVTFVPDLTSSIPLVSAFAVAPQTALAIFAITKVLSPVVDVFTKIRYEVKGPLDSPEVKEISRSKGEYQLDKSVK